MDHETESETIEAVLDVVEYFAVGIEVLAVAIIVVGVTLATYNYLLRRDTGRRGPRGYVRYRESLGRALLLGLEILVAADVVRTVALDRSLESMVVLGLLVLIRTFLSWSLEVEIDRQWPWQHRAEPQPETPAAPDA
jgi:uncharacterized membrane protein